MTFVFQKQKEIMLKYEKIDIATFDINCLQDQQVMKDFAYRCIEELTEAGEEIENYIEFLIDPVKYKDDKRKIDKVQHFKEEFVDFFNFLVEMYIIYGWDVKKLDKIVIDGECRDIAMRYELKSDFKDPATIIKELNTDIRSDLYKIIYAIGQCMNCLKNRPWRSTQYLVDLLVFEERFKELMPIAIRFANLWGMSTSELLSQWSLKMQVNEFRLETDY